MELVSVRIDRPASRPGRVRLVGEVAYDKRGTEREEYWFDFPESYSDSLTLSGNPWLACLLPLAVTRREPLRLCAPVDPVMLDNAGRLMEAWARWYRHLPPVAIVASTMPSEAASGPDEAAALFSGGIDSFFTVLREGAQDRATLPRIDRLLCVWGFDIRLENPGEFERLRTRLSEAARALGKDLIDVATNLMQVRFREANWGRHSHGSALASVALALEKRFHTAYIAPTFGWARPWGSHPESDPLHSTGMLRVIHDAPHVDRWGRTEYVARSEMALRNLHVCPRDKTSSNCGECRKCYLVMMTLDILGCRNGVPIFEKPEIDLSRVRRLYAESPTYDEMFRVIESRARMAGRQDLADAIHECLDRSARVEQLLRAGERISTTKGLWRLARFCRRAVLSGFVQ